ncbi:MAG: sensor histidine kinase KdpD [Sphingomicrobium sp.]
MNDSEPVRPSPDALLRQARLEGRGRLKVYLGASPGVGKTFEMLSDAAGLRRAGVDLVIGVVETHGRAETAALTAGFEIIPKQRIAHQGRTLDEMDLDAILARRPRLVLVDELAHSNAPGSRHAKRYQDVEELLAAGIDVHSTVNIQHVESLNDVVASFTRVRVRETIPDQIIEQAELEVVDLPPDELIERLKDGKVYVPEEASRALGHFFSRSNLSALRELALRQAAQRVDRDILVDVAAAGLSGKWAAGERILVAVSELPGTDNLVRATKRLADAMRAPWTALHIETPRSVGFDDTQRQRLAATLHLAAGLGGEVVSVPGETVLDGITRYAAAARTTQIVVGKSQRSRWFELRHGSIVDRLVRETPDIAVHVLPSQPGESGSSRPAGPPGQWGNPVGYLWSALAVAGVTALGTAIAWLSSVSNLALLYLVPVLFAAIRFGLRTGIVTGLLSALAYNFFFLPPLYTFTISDPENLLTMLVLIAVAVVVSQLAGRVQAQSAIARASAAQNSALASLARKLTGVTSRGDLAEVLTHETARLIGVHAILLQPVDGRLDVVATADESSTMQLIDRAAADWAFEHDQPAGRGTGTLTASEWRFHPLSNGERTLAVLGLADPRNTPLRVDQVKLLVSLLDQAALAFQRVVLEEDMASIAQMHERDRLRAALLSSVSHDLRTPLTMILAASSELSRKAPSEEAALIEAEAKRLNRFIANLLEMVRVETGALDLKLTAVDLTDAVAGAAQDLRQALADHPLRLDVPPDLPLVRADERLLHHCFLNLLENAAKFSPPGSTITVVGERRAGELRLSVLDEGPGLPPGTEESAFETFTRLEGSDRVGGTGLGLAIVRGFAAAMGLTASAANRPDRSGAAFTICFPDSAVLRGEPQQ